MPRDAGEENLWKESLGSKKRTPNRRDPEKRRQQNIIAQRKYREKLRERLGKLDALESSAAQNSPTTNTVQSGSVTGHDLAELSFTGSSMAIASDNQSFPLQADNATSSLSFWDFTTHLTPSDKDMPSLDSWDPAIWDCTPDFSPSDASPPTIAVSDTNMQLPTPETRESTQGAASRQLTHVDSSSRESSVGGFFVTTTVDCNCANPHIQVQTRDCISYSCVQVRILRIGALASTAPDPYTNHLRLEMMCTLSAMDSLRMHVGMTEGMMCEDEAPSPFYRPIRESAGDATKQDMISTVQRIFKTLKPDLRPSSEQITIDHPPYIDVLPFRTLRKNLILRQQEVDEDEFLRDAVTGLVCWGGAGLSRKDRDASTGNASNGTPWDNRSWEAKGWFLNKYWSLLGGEDGELVQQSEWWRNIRGEKPLVLEAMA